jgi:ABC-type tungstate transport system substrate-binding protein
MIPVYRPTTRPGETHKNQHMFSACFAHLAERRSLLIFPEGVSITERKLKPLKSGVARIARGAELKAGKKADIKIVPIGLNYSSPHQFRSELYVNIGKPIRVVELLSGGDANEHEEVEKITAAVTNALLEVVLHVEDEGKENLLDQIELLYLDVLKSEQSLKQNDQASTFNVQKEIISAIEYFEKADPSTAAKLKLQLDDFFSMIKSRNLMIHHKKTRNTAQRILLVLHLIVGLPAFLIGAIINYVPYKATRSLNTIITDDISFRGSMTIATGLVLFLVWYTGLTIAGCFTPIGWWALFIPILSYLFGLYAAIYKSMVDYINERSRFKAYLKAQPEFAREFMTKRNRLVAKLDEMKGVYVGSRVESSST